MPFRGFDNSLLYQGLLFSLPFEEGAGTIRTQDVAKPHHPMSLVHAPVWTTLASGLQVLEFDGANDYIECASADCVDLDFTAGDFSFACWCYFDDLGASRMILGRYQLDVSGWEFYGYGTYLSLRASHGGVPVRTSAAGSGLVTLAWLLLGLSRSGGYPLMYLNGRQMPMVYDPAGGITDPAACGQDLVIGTRFTKDSNYFDGKMWNPRIWGRRLESWEQMEIFNRERVLLGV